MITIQSGKMIIPEEERFVGFAGDDRVNTKEFILPQMRITNIDDVFSLYLRFDDDRVTSAPLSVEIADSDTILTWTIRAEHLLRQGIVMAQIKYVAADGSVTHYSWDYFVVGAAAELADDGSEIDVLSRSEFEERMAQAVRDARATAPYIGDDGYWYIYSREQDAYVRSFSASGIDVDSAVSASSTHPVENRAVKAYVDAGDSAKVDRTTRIAGIALSGNISADALYENMAGKINPPLVTPGVTAGMPGQYGRTSDGVPVFCAGMNQWVPLAEGADIPTKTSELDNDAGFLTAHQDISGKMDCVKRVNDPSRISEIARDQLFECQGAIGITGHSAGSSYTGLAKQETMDLALRDISDIRSYLGYPSGYGTGIVGLQVDFVNKTFTRLADASSLSAGANFDRFRMYGGRRRCNVADDGTINAFYGDAGYKDDGTNGQVMVYQPAFWYRVVPLRLEENVVGYHIRRANYYISETPRHGFKLHPLFYDANGNALEYVLMSAYEASMYDVSASAYVDDTVDSVAYALGDLLCSVAGQKPISGELSGIGTKANFETMAGNRGTGWHLDTVKSVMANQLLMMIEMGSLNMQEAIGRGVVDCANVGDHNTSSLTGATASLGNATGMALETTQSVAGSTTVNTVDGKLSVTYRGMENPWGNLFKHVQGLNLWGDGTMGGGQAYVCSDDSFNESKHDDNYSPSGICLSNQNGYISAFGYSDEEYDWLLLPTETLGNSALPVGDQLTTVSNINRNGFFQQGGDWSAGTSGGMFYYRCSGGMSGNRKNNIGGRLLYIPTAVV